MSSCQAWAADTTDASFSDLELRTASVASPKNKIAQYFFSANASTGSTLVQSEIEKLEANNDGSYHVNVHTFDEIDGSARGAEAAYAAV